MPETKLPPGSVVVISSPDAGLAKALTVAASPSPKDGGEKKAPEVTTEHTTRIRGVEVPYRAIAGKMSVKRGEATASVFYVAYLRTDVQEGTERPLMFSFNGGPGSSSVWLHMGALGPVRVPFDVDDQRPPPWVGEPNPYSLLDRTDLVFVDPVGTGFSTAEDEGKPFWSVEGDVESVGDFIRVFVSKHGRWASPILLAGESYGTTRCAGLAPHLAQKHGLALRGVVLMSVAMQLQTLFFGAGNVIPEVLMLPTAAATAVYHGRVEVADREAFYAEVEAFTLDTYLPALMRGGRLSSDERRDLAERIAAYIGVSAEFVLRCNLRPTQGRFCRELLRDVRRTVGRLDSRFTGRERDAAGDDLGHDPSLMMLMGPFTSALHHHLRHRLEWVEDDPYTVISFDVNSGWNWEPHVNSYVDVADKLREAMDDNPHLGVFVASGRYDLATPWCATDYTLAQIGWEPELAARIRHHLYEAGHMMYLHPPSLEKLRADLDDFLDSLGFA